MKKLLVAAVFVAAFAVSATANSFIKLSLFDTISWPHTNKANLGLGLLYSNTPAVSGLDFNFFVSKVDNLTGVQWSMVNITGDATGWESAFVQYSTGDFTGLQSAFINYNPGDVTGVQWGAGNYVGDLLGVQFGFLNYAKNFKGLQLGFINYAERIDVGLQVGLVNVIRSNGWLPVMVFVNGKF